MPSAKCFDPVELEIFKSFFHFIAEEWKRPMAGDVAMLNDPFCGGTHLRLAVPVYWAKSLQKGGKHA